MKKFRKVMAFLVTVFMVITMAGIPVFADSLSDGGQDGSEATDNASGITFIRGSETIPISQETIDTLIAAAEEKTITGYNESGEFSVTAKFVKVDDLLTAAGITKDPSDNAYSFISADGYSQPVDSDYMFKMYLYKNDTGYCSAIDTESDNYWVWSLVSIKVNALKPPMMLRFGGEDRYETAAAINRIAYLYNDGSSSAILTSGEDFADALSAAAYSGMKDMPILLTKPDELNSYTKDLINKWGVTDITIIGGESAVSKTVVDSLISDCGISADRINRISGKDRYETALMVEEKGNFDTSGACVIATGKDYPDAISISSWCRYLKMPMILVNQELTGDALATAEKYSKIYIVGGESAVNPETEIKLKAVKGEENVIRLSGSDRYQTSAAIAARFTATEKHYDETCFATGEDFSDALAGAIFASNVHAPILLVKGTSGPAFDFVKEKYAVEGSGVSLLIILGKWEAVPLLTENAIQVLWT